MSKITPQNYVQATTRLSRAGFNDIKALEKEGKSIEDIAQLLDVHELDVSVVMTTTSYTEFETIVQLEIERADAEERAEANDTLLVPKKPKTWHYVVALAILGLSLYGVVWLVIQLIQWLGGLL